MKPNQRFTKGQERTLLQQLASDRKDRTPDRLEPTWLTLFWLCRGVRA